VALVQGQERIYSEDIGGALFDLLTVLKERNSMSCFGKGQSGTEGQTWKDQFSTMEITEERKYFLFTKIRCEDAGVDFRWSLRQEGKGPAASMVSRRTMKTS